MILINGTSGIGTGYSTFIPCYNPDDIIENIKRLNSRKSIIPMKPWYRNFKGTITPNEKNTGYITKGNYECINNIQIRITELPIGVWTTKYIEYLKSLALDKRKIKKLGIESNIIKNQLLNRSDKLNVDITIKFIKPWNELFENLSEMEAMLGLTSNLATTNMWLYNEKNILQKFKTPEDILQYWYNVRLGYYQRRKDWLIDNLQVNLTENIEKIRFIEAILNKKLIIEKRKKIDIENDLLNMKFISKNESYDYLLGMPLWSLTQERINKLNEQIKQYEAEITEIKNKTIINLWNDDLNQL